MSFCVEVTKANSSKKDFDTWLEDTYQDINTVFERRSAACKHKDSYVGRDGKKYCSYCWLDLKKGGD